MGQGLFFSSGIDRGYEKDLERMNRKTNKFSRNVKKQGISMDNTFKRVGANLSAMVGILAIGAAGKQIVDFSINLETALIEVATISGEVSENMEEYKDVLIAMSTEEDKAASSAQQLAEALYDIVSAGQEGEDALVVLNAAAVAGTAGFVEVGVAADGLTTVMNAWGKTAEDVNEISDIFFKTVEKGKTTFPLLASNIAQVGPLAASLGVSFEEVSAAVASITKKGVPTAQAFTQIRSALVGMNQTLGDGWAETMTLQEGFIEIARQAEGSATGIQKLVGRVEGMNAVLSLTGENAAGAAQDLEAMNNTLNATAEAAEKVTQTTEHQVKNLKNNILAALEPLGDQASNIIGKIARELNEAFKSGEVEKYARILLKLGKAFILYKVTVIAVNRVQKLNLALTRLSHKANIKSVILNKKVTASTLIMAKSFKKLKLAFVGNPLGILITALIMVIPLIGLFKTSTKEATEKQDQFNDSLRLTATLLKSFATIKERQGIVGVLGKEELKSQKESILEQLAIEKNFNRELLEDTKDRLEADAEIKRLFALTSNKEITEILRAGYAKQLRDRKEKVVAELQVEEQARQTRVKLLKDYLIVVNDLISKLKEPTTGLSEAELKKAIKALKIEHQKRINLINEHYGEQEDLQKTFHEKRLRNELLYLQELRKLTKSELSQLQIDEKTFDLKKALHELNEELDILKDLTGVTILNPTELITVKGEIDGVTKGLKYFRSGIGDVNLSFEETLQLMNNVNELTTTLVNSFDDFAEAPKAILTGIAEASAGFINLASAVQLVSNTMTSLEKASVILTVISAALQIISAVNTAIQDIQQAKIDKYINELDKVHAINIALLEQNKLHEEGNRLFSDDQWGTALAGLKTYNQALVFQNEAIQSINESQSRLPDTPSILTAWGGIFAAFRESFALDNIKTEAQSYATAVEQALGGIAIKTKDRGGFANFFGFKDQFESLLTLYPEVIDANGDLNTIILQSILDTQDLGEADRTRLEGLVELIGQAETAYAQFGDYISSIFGNVGGEIAQAFQNMFETGDDAMTALQGSFSDMIESFTRDAIEFALLQPYLNTLDQITKALGEDFAKGNITAAELQEGIIGALGDFYNVLQTIQPEILQAFENADILAAGFGFEDAFNVDVTPIVDAIDGIGVPEEADISRAGQISQAITEETGSQLVGRMGAIMLSNERLVNFSADALDYAMQNLIVMKQIKLNTDYLPEIAENTRKTAERL